MSQPSSHTPKPSFEPTTHPHFYGSFLNEAINNVYIILSVLAEEVGKEAYLVYKALPKRKDDNLKVWVMSRELNELHFEGTIFAWYVQPDELQRIQMEAHRQLAIFKQEKEEYYDPFEEEQKAKEREEERIKNLSKEDKTAYYRANPMNKEAKERAEEVEKAWRARKHEAKEKYKDVYETYKETVDLLDSWQPLSSDEQQRYILRLKVYFPFMDSVNDLMLLLQLLNKMRDQFSHYRGENLRYQRQLEVNLSAIYLKAIEGTKRFEHIKDEDRERLIADPIGDIGSQLDRNGLIFLTCLFLDRKSANVFLSKISGYKRTEKDFESAKRETFTNFCCRLPKPKLDSADVMLDMINELNRCPKVLYDLFSEQEKTYFHTPIVNPQDVELLEKDENDQTLNHARMIRHNDRFGYFALRFLEEMQVFPTLRFQIHLGRLVQKTYESTIDKQKQQRVLHKTLRTFGYLQPYEAQTDNLPEHWSVLSDTKERTYTVEQYSPRYNIKNNHIPIAFETETSIFEKDSDALKARKNPQAFAFLNTAELPDLVFYVLLLHHEGGKTLQEAGEIIENEIKFYAEAYDSTQKAISENQITANGTIANLQARIKAFNGNEPFILVKNLAKRQRYALLNRQVMPYDVEVLRKLEWHKEKNKELIDKIKIKDTSTGTFAQKQKKKERNAAQLVKENAVLNGEWATVVAKDLIKLMQTDPKIKNGGKPNPKAYQILQAKIALLNRYNQQDLWEYMKEIGVTERHIFINHYIYQVNLNNPQKVNVIANLKKADTAMNFVRAYLAAKAVYLDNATKEVNPLRYDRDRKEYVPKSSYSKMKKEDIERKYGFWVAPTQQTNPKADTGFPTQLPRAFFKDHIQPLVAQKVTVGDYKYSQDTAHLIHLYTAKDTQPFYDFERQYYFSVKEERPDNPQSIKIWLLKKEINEKISQWYAQKGKKEAFELPFLPQIPAAKGISNAESTIQKDTFNYLDTEDFRVLKKDIFAILKKQVDAKKKEKKALHESKNGSKEKFEAIEQYIAPFHAFTEKITEKEREIRYTQTTDRVLWLMVQVLANAPDRQQEGNAQYRPKIECDNFTLETVHRLLNEEHPISINYKGRTITDEKLPIGQYGEFRSLLKDKRIDGFIEHYYCQSETTIQRTDIIQNFEAFEEYSFDVLAQIFEFEKIVLEKIAEWGDTKETHLAIQQQGTEDEYIDHKTYIKFLNDKGITQIAPNIDFGVNDKELAMLRNGLLHSQFKASYDSQEAKDSYGIMNWAEKASKTYQYLSATYFAYTQLSEAVRRL